MLSCHSWGWNGICGLLNESSQVLFQGSILKLWFCGSLGWGSYHGMWYLVLTRHYGAHIRSRVSLFTHLPVGHHSRACGDHTGGGWPAGAKCSHAKWALVSLYCSCHESCFLLASFWWSEECWPQWQWERSCGFLDVVLGFFVTSWMILRLAFGESLR